MVKVQVAYALRDVLGNAPQEDNLLEIALDTDQEPLVRLKAAGSARHLAPMIPDQVVPVLSTMIEDPQNKEIMREGILAAVEIARLDEWQREAATEDDELAEDEDSAEDTDDPSVPMLYRTELASVFDRILRSSSSDSELSEPLFMYLDELRARSIGDAVALAEVADEEGLTHLLDELVSDLKLSEPITKELLQSGSDGVRASVAKQIIDPGLTDSEEDVFPDELFEPARAMAGDPATQQYAADWLVEYLDRHPDEVIDHIIELSAVPNNDVRESVMYALRKCAVVDPERVKPIFERLLQPVDDSGFEHPVELRERTVSLIADSVEEGLDREEARILLLIAQQDPAEPVRANATDLLNWISKLPVDA